MPQSRYSSVLEEESADFEVLPNLVSPPNAVFNADLICHPLNFGDHNALVVGLSASRPPS
jgi:hypothetical protein